MAQPCSLYRHFDAAGRLLYVGISLSAVARLSRHRAEAPWAKAIAKITTEDHATRADAHAAERLAIRTEKPLHNKVRYDSDREPAPRFVSFMPALSAADADSLARRLPHRLTGDEISSRSAAHLLGLRPNELRSLTMFPGHTDPLMPREVIDIGWRLILGAAIVDPIELDEQNTFLPSKLASKAFGRRHALVDACRLADGGAHAAAAEIVARHHTKFRTTPPARTPEAVA